MHAVEFLKTSIKENVNLTYRSDRLAIDHSKKVPELESIHKVFSKDDLRKICDFYEGLIRTDFKIDDIGDLKEAAKLQAMAGLYLAQNLKTHVDDSTDLGMLGSAWGTSGEPTRTVKILHSTFNWLNPHLYLNPEQSMEFYNSTTGYRQVTIELHTNTTIYFYGYGGIWELFELPVAPLSSGNYTHRIYPVAYPYIDVALYNPSTTHVADIWIRIFMTT